MLPGLSNIRNVKVLIILFLRRYVYKKLSFCILIFEYILHIYLILDSRCVSNLYVIQERYKSRSKSFPIESKRHLIIAIISNIVSCVTFGSGRCD